MGYQNLERSEAQSRKLFTGFLTADVVAVNPTKEKRAEIMGYTLKDDAEDLHYEGKTERGDEFVAISFLLKEKKEGYFFEKRFRFVDKDVLSEGTGKQQFVNQSGLGTWADDKESLPEWFTNFQNKDKVNIAPRECKAAIQGELNFYNFMRAWLGKVNFASVKSGVAANSIFIDKKKMFRNIDTFVKNEITPLFTAKKEESLITPIYALATIYVGEKDGEVKYYQNLYSEFFNEYAFNKIKPSIITKDWNSDRVDKSTKKFYEQLTGEFGCKDIFTLDMLKEFDPSNYVQSSNNTLIESQEENDDKPPFDSEDHDDTDY